MLRDFAQCLVSGATRGACPQYIGSALFAAVFALIIASLLWAWRVRHGDSRRPALWYSALEAAIVVSLGGIAVLTLDPYATGGSGPVNLIPFLPLIESVPLGEFYVGLALFDVLGNVALFVPLGLLVAVRFASLGVTRWAATVVVFAAGIESTQALVLNRSGDITDVITNAAGGVFGFLIGRFLQRLGRNSGLSRSTASSSGSGLVGPGPLAADVDPDEGESGDEADQPDEPEEPALDIPRKHSAVVVRLRNV